MLAGEDEEQREEVAGVRQTHMSFEWSDGTGESDFNQLLGKRVRIIGLTGRPELNGCLGAYALHLSAHCLYKTACAQSPTTGQAYTFLRFQHLALVCGRAHHV